LESHFNYARYPKVEDDRFCLTSGLDCENVLGACFPQQSYRVKALVPKYELAILTQFYAVNTRIKIMFLSI
jgi:hypothetical protein